MGRLYQQTAIDTYSNVGFAKLYIEKTLLSTADFLNDRVLSFYDGYGVRVLRVLKDYRAVERLNQVIEDEFYKVAFRKKLYKTLEDMGGRS